MHGDMVRFIALDFILRLIGIGAMRVSFVVDVSCMHLDNRATDASGLGIPGDVVADFEAFRHFMLLDVLIYTTTLSRFAARVMPV
jgi:hypothetical protein